jgi:hypothetical protein
MSKDPPYDRLVVEHFSASYTGIAGDPARYPRNCRLSGHYFGFSAPSHIPTDSAVPYVISESTNFEAEDEDQILVSCVTEQDEGRVYVTISGTLYVAQ